jgi:hypothetical protein
VTRESDALPWLFLVVSLALATLAGACAEPEPPRFPHRVHLVDLCGPAGKAGCMNCNTCHSLSERELAHELPSEQLCKRCHRDDAHEVRQVLTRTPLRRYGKIAFDHARHLTLTGINGQCVSCHAGVVAANRPAVPPMSQCFTCHEHERQWQRGECAPCHTASELKGILPETFLRHDTSFARRHGQLAMEDKKLCQACHSQAQCDDCHDMTQDLTIERRRLEQVERSFVHSGDFMSRHAIEAESQPARCARCHAPETCDSCHVARGVSGNRIDGRNPHPPGWVGTNTNSQSFHGRAARRDILACASCHDQGPATNCVRCHKVGGYGGNPHPHGWKSARTTSEQMCRYCHE